MVPAWVDYVVLYLWTMPFAGTIWAVITMWEWLLGRAMRGLSITSAFMSLTLCLWGLSDASRANRSVLFLAGFFLFLALRNFILWMLQRRPARFS